MKNSLIVVTILTAILSQASWATPKSDSLLAFTGSSRAKFVWERWAWANEDYTGKTAAQLSAEGRAMMLFDTQEGTERLLDKTANKNTYHSFMRISRSGKWLTWNDIPAGKTYILDLTSPTATKKVLLDKASCSYWCARAMWVDPATKTEYIYCLDNYDATAYNGNGIRKLPLKADGTADVSKVTTVTYKGGAKVDDAISVSADGTKMGGAFPWPDTYILDVATGNLEFRHDGPFGCQANLAPDNSYRFFHCESDHFGINMFPTYPATAFTFIDMSKNLVGNPASNTTDFAAPRWTNNVQFVTNTYPMGDNGAKYEDDNMLVGQSAVYVKALKIYMVGSFVLEKFAADFKTIASSIGVGQDVRYRQSGGDGWLNNGVIGDVVSANPATRHIAAPRSSTVGTVVSSLRVMDAQGRLVRRPDALSASANKLDAKVYLVSSGSGKSRVSQKMTVVK